MSGETALYRAVPVSALTPDGISFDTIYALEALMRSIALAGIKESHLLDWEGLRFQIVKGLALSISLKMYLRGSSANWQIFFQLLSSNYPLEHILLSRLFLFLHRRT